MYEYDIGIGRKGPRSGKEKGIAMGEDPGGKKYFLDPSVLDGHMLVLGKTGTGKSTFLSGLIQQIGGLDCNIVVIDPHGELTTKSIGLCPGKELLYFGPGVLPAGDAKKAVMCNFLTNSGSEDDLERTSEWIRSIFSREELISSGTWGPRLQVIFSSVLREYMRQDGKKANISGFLNALVSRDRLEKLSEGSRDENLKQILHYQSRNWNKWLDYAGSSINKLLGILSNSRVRSLISSEEETVDISSELLKSNRLLVSGISKVTNSEETARVFSLLLLMRVWNSITGSSGRSDTYIFIDEAQNIPESIMELMLSEGRKFGIHLVLGTQFLNSRDDSFEKYLLGNIKSYACFQLSSRDAFTMSRNFSGKLSERVGMILKEQSYHRFLFWSGGSFAARTPVTLSTRLLDTSAMGRITAERIGRAIEKHGSDLPEYIAPAKPGRKTLHSIMIDRFAEYIESRGILFRKEHPSGRSVSDGFFTYEGREYAVECEVSDMSSRFRVLEKIRNTGGEMLVFLIPEVNRQKLIEYIASPTSFYLENGILIEKPLVRKNSTIHASEIWSKLDQILIVSYDGRQFMVNGKTKTVRFSTGRLSSEWATALYSHSTVNPEERKRIFSFMKKTGKFVLSRKNRDLASYVGTGIPEHTVPSEVADTITCGDLILMGKTV